MEAIQASAWDADHFELTNLGLSVRPKVLISGGGDGALQDYLRIVTRLPAERLYRRLRAQTALTVRLAEVEPKIHSAEDQAQRAYIWGSSKTTEYDHEIHSVLHRAHLDAVREIYNDAPARAELEGELQRLFESNFVRKVDVPDVELIYTCDHFSKCYGLNRFLVLLVARYLEDRLGRTTLFPFTRLKSVQGETPHSCANKPTACHGESHDVTFEAFACRGPQRSTPKPSSTYQVVILRHGVSSGPTFRHLGKPIALPRQALPYHATL